MRFLDLPWFSGAERPLRETLQRSVPAGGLQRLAALGVDACRLQSRIGLFDWMNGAGLGGATGELVLDGTRRLHRQSQWYVFSNGLAVPEEQRTAMLATSLNARSTEGETPWTGHQRSTPAATGRAAEDRALKELSAAGLRLVARNFRCRLGEIDLVMREGDTLVFVEVRQRRSARFGDAAESVTAAKQRKLQAAAALFVAWHPALRRYADAIRSLRAGRERTRVRTAVPGVKWLRGITG